jgi:hypothetical protein
MRLAIRVTIICLIATSLICLAACAGEKAGNEIQIIEHKLSIHEFGGDVLQSIAAIDGKAKNTSNLTLSSASIIVNFYDKDSNLLHTASTMKQNLATGEIWHFNIKFTDPDAWKTVHYDISTSTNQ